jgi:uncharacterized protein YxeA
MKKIIFLLITICLLTGCTATYDINITKETINDTIKIEADSTKVNNANKQTTDTFNQKIGEWENGHDFYKREIITTADKTGYQYTYNFNFDEYDAMSQIRKCYKDFNLTYDNDIELTTSKEFLCRNYYPQVKTFTINITSEYEITSSNADSIKDNVHTWKINANNYKVRPINIKINKSKMYIPEEEPNYKNIKSIIFIIIFFILVIIFIKRKKDIKQ